MKTGSCTVSTPSYFVFVFCLMLVIKGGTLETGSRVRYETSRSNPIVGEQHDSSLDQQHAASSGSDAHCGPCLCAGTVVDCSSLGLTDVPVMLPSQTTVINLSNNSISSLQPKAFIRFSNLERLDISSNAIENLTGPDIFAGLGNLLVLKLARNRLHECRNESYSREEVQPNTLFYRSKKVSLTIAAGACFRPFSIAIKLRELDLSNNEFATLDEDMFFGLRAVATLDLRQNKIPLNDAAYPKGVFQPMASTLAELHLEGNCNVFSPVGCWDYPEQALSVLVHLETLIMDGLPDTSLSKIFEGLTALKSLNLSGTDVGVCNLSVIDNTTFLRAPRSLKVLNISRCEIRDIAPTAFEPLKAGLIVLDLSVNYALGFDILGEAFYGLQGSRLQELHINAVVHPFSSCVKVTPHNTRYFANTTLERIYAQNNMLEQFCQGALRNMPDTLTFVSLSKNRLMFGAYLQDLKHLKGLKVIELNGERHALQLPRKFPSADDRRCEVRNINVDSLCPSSHYRSMQHFPVWKPGDSSEDRWEKSYPEQGWDSPGSPDHTSSRQVGLIFQLPPNLTSIRARYNKLFFRLENIHFNSNNSLQMLDLKSNLLSLWLENITGLEKVTSLFLSSNLCSTVKVDFFKNFPSLVNLQLDINFLRFAIQSDVDGQMLLSLANLQKLSLQRNYINFIPPKFFRGLKSLTTLDLSHNEIDNFTVDLGHMTGLMLLNLSFNNIHFLPKDVMDQLDVIANNTTDGVLVDLTFNPIACTCSNIYFLTWLKDSKVNFTGSYNLTCLMADGTYRNMTDVFQELAHLRSACSNNSGVLAGTLSCCFCLLTALLTALAYRHRWKLRYLYYATRLAYSGSGNSQRMDNFVFDAFVSYASEDEDFIREKVIKELEERADLRLNVHFRDFIPGRPIPCNIVDAVQNSRHTLVVLSRHLLASDWCHYELQMALMEAAHTGRDVLLFLLYEEDIPEEELTKDILYNLQASTYIAFPRGQHGTPEQLSTFWSRLAVAIRK